MLFAPFIPRIGGLIDRLIPDKTAAAKAKAELAVMEQNGELKLLMGQLEINKEEAKSNSMFVAGWRPFVGWICGLALCWHYLLLPLFLYVNVLLGLDVTPPAFDLGDLIVVLGGMLGLGGLRTFEKFKGVQR